MTSRSLWDRFWFGEASLVRLAAFRIVMLVAAFQAIWKVRIGIFLYADQLGTELVRRPWNPIYLFEVLHVPPPSAAVVHVVYWTVLVAIALGIVGLFTRVACGLAAVLVLYWLGTNYSLGKPHHDCIQLTFGLLALPLAPVGARLSVDSLIRRLRAARDAGDPTAVPEVGPLAALPLRVTQISLALGYFFAGATKLAVSGPGWANGYTLQAIMLEYHSPWSELLSQRVFACMLMQVGLLAVQVSFPLIFLSPRLRWFYVPAATLFHLVAMYTMATGPFITMWFTLVAFVALERIPAFLERNVASGPLVRRLLVGLGLSGTAWFVVSLYFEQKPPWLLLALVPPALALLFGLLPRMKLVVSFDPGSAPARRCVALLDALDWSNRLSFLRAEGAHIPLAARTRSGTELAGRRAYRAALWRLPLGWVLIPLAVGRSGDLAMRPRSGSG